MVHNMNYCEKNGRIAMATASFRQRELCEGHNRGLGSSAYLRRWAVSLHLHQLDPLVRKGGATLPKLAEGRGGRGADVRRLVVDAPADLRGEQLSLGTGRAQGPNRCTADGHGAVR